MRNLKKILALALALVMSMSLMATANAFTDDDSITDTYETAVTVLSGLKVFQGYDDGSFLPQGAITRAEVAAIIYRIVTGDVADTQVGIYADYNKFDDVASTSWYAGYVNFCANAEYIKGYDARTFGPNDPVTGYQALAMILRALGYDKNGEFTGTNWTIQTAAVGEQRGITKNITAGTLNVPATREVVAEILFRAILVPTVSYTPAFGYTIGDTSLGYKTFGLEEITGVVVANEYADLYGTSPLRAGRTELDVDGENYTVDYATTLEDIGEARAAYITGATVLAIGDAGNTVFETGDEADINSDSKFEDVTGMERDDATEYFLNFDGGDTYKASDYRIKYVLTTDSPSDAAVYEAEYGITMTLANGEYTYEKTIRPEAAISDLDMQIMKDIFYDADLKDGNTEAIVMGEVYVGTQSTEDISDDRNVSWKSFVEEYIVTGENSTEVVGNENGNWLKVVDVDGDGVADYVMKTIYTFAGVEDIDRDDNIELTAVDANLNDGDEVNKIDEDVDIVSEDELSEGDIVYYALIDGNAQTYLAEMVTAEIDSVNRRTDTATTTDGDEYVESDVHNHVVWDEFDDGVVNLAGNTSYDLYLDKYGYLGVFTETATSGDFALLTDGWFMSQRAGDEYAAMVWDREAQELVDTDITSGGDLFISDSDNNHWGQLEDFVGINDDGLPVGDDMKTIVASLSADGDLTPVDDVFNKRDVRIVAIDDNEILGRSYTNGTSYTTSSRADKAYDLNSGDVEIRALASTVYYYVYEDSNGNTVVNEYVGYNNLPSLDAASKDMIEDVYAVGTRTDREGSNSESGETEYFTASVVVVEFSGRYLADAEQVFIVDTPVVGTNVHIDEVEVIRADGTFETVTIDLENSDYETIGTRAEADYGVANFRTLMPGLYYMWETEDEGIYTVTSMSRADIADNRYGVGVVTTGAQYEDDWVEIQEYIYNARAIEGVAINSWPEYRVAEDSLFYTLSYDWDDDFNADLDASEARYVLDEEGDRDTTEDDRVYANNTVLIAYNSSNEIIYAISFANYDGENAAGTDMIRNFAQHVWDGVKPIDPSQGTQAPASVALYDAAGNKVMDLAQGTNSVPYSVWKDIVGSGTVVVTPAAGNEIAISNLTTFTSSSVTVPTTIGTGDTIVVLSQGDQSEAATASYTYEIDYVAPGTTASLMDKKGTTTLTDDAEVTSFTIPADKSIQEFIDQFYLSDKDATIVWNFVTKGGTPFSFTGMTAMNVPGNVTTSEIDSVTATVTPENGDTTANKVYKDGSATAADVLAEAKEDAADELNAFAAPLTRSAGEDAESDISGNWFNQNVPSKSAVVQKTVSGALSNINSATNEAGAVNAMLRGKIDIVADVIEAAHTNLLRLMGNGAGDSADGSDSEYWNDVIEDAFNEAMAVFQATPDAAAWTDGTALTDILDAYDAAFEAIQDNILNTEPVYQAHFWVASTKGNVQIALMRYNDAQGKQAGTWLSQAEIEALDLTAAEFSITLNGTEYPAEKIVAFLSSSDTGVTTNPTLIDNNAGVIKINVGANVFVGGETLNLGYDGTKSGNVTFALTFATLNVNSFGGTISVPTA